MSLLDRPAGTMPARTLGRGLDALLPAVSEHRPIAAGDPVEIFEGALLDRCAGWRGGFVVAEILPDGLVVATGPSGHSTVAAASRIRLAPAPAPASTPTVDDCAALAKRIARATPPPVPEAWTCWSYHSRGHVPVPVMVLPYPGGKQRGTGAQLVKVASLVDGEPFECLPSSLTPNPGAQARLAEAVLAAGGAA